MPTVCLLGPQRLRPTLDRAIGDLGLAGPFAVITAGWEEREREMEELDLHIGETTVNLCLFNRAEQVYREDRKLFRANQKHHDRRRELRELYTLRLAHALAAARELERRRGEAALLGVERKDAMAAVRRLDLHHLRRMRTLQAEYEDEWAPAQRLAVRPHREEILSILDASSALLIAGGHVINLLHCLRLFDLAPAIEKMPIVAWSAGAMVLGERIVLFHDNPPQGRGNSEVSDAGLGLYPGLVPLPHARRRLRLDDTRRVSLFARRVAPSICVAMEDGARLVWDGRAWRSGPGNYQLTPRGAVVSMETG